LSQEAKQLFEQHVQQHVQGIMVGAQGAMPFGPDMLEMANNPETVKQLEAQAKGEAPVGEEPAPPPEQG